MVGNHTIVEAVRITEVGELDIQEVEPDLERIHQQCRHRSYLLAPFEVAALVIHNRLEGTILVGTALVGIILVAFDLAGTVLGAFAQVDISLTEGTAQVDITPMEGTAQVDITPMEGTALEDIGLEAHKVDVLYYCDLSVSYRSDTPQ